MLSVIGWVPLSAALVVIGAAIALGWIKPTRDFFFLLVFAQGLVYLDISPTLILSRVSFESAGRYVYFQWMALLLFQLPLLWIYVRRMRRTEHPAAMEPDADGANPGLATSISPGRALLLFGGTATLALAYFVIGARYGLLDRRAADVTANQLNLTFIEFALFRSFTVIGSFLVGLQLFVLRKIREDRPLWMTGAFVVSGAAYLAFALLNSRLVSITFVATLYGVYLITAQRQVRFRAAVFLGGLMTVVFAVYSLRVTQNVRQAVGSGESMFAPANFLPFSSNRGVEADPLSSRLNGLDLIVLISGNVERYGPAWGTAWAVPVIVSLDPIVRTNFTVQAKRAELTTAKSFLLLMYAGIAVPDYYNCLLSDAYGNLGLFGFPAAALVLGWLLAWGTGLLRRARKPIGIVLGLFIITRILPFEQEFGTILFGWLKALPLFLLVALVYPLRTPSWRDESPEPMPAPALLA